MDDRELEVLLRDLESYLILSWLSFQKCVTI